MKIIAGPCQHETREISLKIAKECKRVCDKHGIDYFFKASYDKANRSSYVSDRGVGFDRTFLDFVWLKTQIPELKILTDVHTVEDMQRPIIGCIDAVQIPALLSRQTDLILAAVKTGLIVNIKKGQFMSPHDIINIMSKTHGAKELWITERGTSFGYNNLIVDYAGMNFMMKYISKCRDTEFVFDASHSAQEPSTNGATSGGSRGDIEPMIRAASALGVQNFFMEVHPTPNKSPSDADTTLYLSAFERVVKDIIKFNYIKP